MTSNVLRRTKGGAHEAKNGIILTVLCEFLILRCLVICLGLWQLFGLLQLCTSYSFTFFDRKLLRHVQFVPPGAQVEALRRHSLADLDGVLMILGL